MYIVCTYILAVHCPSRLTRKSLSTPSLRVYMSVCMYPFVCMYVCRCMCCSSFPHNKDFLNWLLVVADTHAVLFAVLFSAFICCLSPLASSEPFRAVLSVCRCVCVREREGGGAKLLEEEGEFVLYRRISVRMLGYLYGALSISLYILIRMPYPLTFSSPTK